MIIDGVGGHSLDFAVTMPALLISIQVLRIKFPRLHTFWPPSNFYIESLLMIKLKDSETVWKKII